MSGSLLSAARKDAKRYVKEGGFQEDIFLSTPSGHIGVNITGLKSKHHFEYESDGTLLNDRNAHICIDEDDLAAENYPVRDSNGEINLINHRVRATDSSGEEKNYIIKENLPDETLGLIVCLLGDFEFV